MQTSTNKILTLEELFVKSRECRDSGKKVVLCHGIFDLIHAGHIRYLKSARDQGDVLFVTLTADEFINKGPGRPVFPQELRAENLGYLSLVDFVAVNNAATAVNVLSEIKPHAYVKGPDYKNMEDGITGNIHTEKKAVEAHGGKIVFTDDITFSSTSLLNEHFGVFPIETKDYLNSFKQKHSYEEIIGVLEDLENLNVLEQVLQKPLHHFG